MTTAEEWRPVPGREGAYEVSSFGRLRSLDRIAPNSLGHMRHYRGRMLAPSIDRDGYECCQIGRKVHVKVHRLVALAFIGEPPSDQHVVCHSDGVPGNNRASNLRYDTAAGNSADLDTHGTRPFGENHGLARTTAETVAAARKDYATGAFTQKALADKYSLTSGNISNIVRGVSWKRLPSQAQEVA